MAEQPDTLVLTSMIRHLEDLVSKGETKISPRLLMELARNELKLTVNNNGLTAYNRAIRELRPDLDAFLSPLRKATEHPARERVKLLEADLQAKQAEVDHWKSLAHEAAMRLRNAQEALQSTISQAA